MANSPGQLLRHAREEKNLSLEQVAAGTNIRIQYLQAIEEDRLGAIASQAQYRGFTRLYASYLGENPLTLFDEEPAAAESFSAPTIVEPEAKKPRRKKGPGVTEKTAQPSSESEPRPEQKIQPASVDKKKTPISDMIFKEIGAQLKQQREDLGLSLADVERQIKIREIFLYALENGQIEELPSSVQGRGMLNNYASFMSLNSDPLQIRFAEGLQQRRVELTVEELDRKKSNEIKKFGSPITGWRRYMTPDLLVGSSVFIILFVLIIWGAWQVIGTSRRNALPTVDSISSILVGTDTLAAPLEGTSTPQSSPEEAATIPATMSVDLLATITAVSDNPIQVVVVAYQRAYLKVVADGKEVFVGRIVPGNVYTYTGSKKISLTGGNAAAMQVYYNKQDLGFLGVNGQVVNIEFMADGMVTPTPKFTASPLPTKMPTLTPQPTNTLQPTATPSITPYTP